MNDGSMIQDDDPIFEEGQEEKTEEEGSENQDKEEDGKEEEGGDDPEGKEEKGKSRRSEIAQKKHWREKAKLSSAKVKELEEELETLRSAVKKPTDEKEKAAQDYIREQARSVFTELRLEREKAEAKDLSNFEEELESVLDENPDVAEDELLDIIEDLDVSPAVALKIFKRDTEGKSEKTKKPKLPVPKRGNPSGDKAKKDDANKSLYDIAREEAARFKE